MEGLAKLATPNMDRVDVRGFIILVHRPDLEVCSDSYLDSLFHINCNLASQPNPFGATQRCLRGDFLLVFFC